MLRPERRINPKLTIHMTKLKHLFRCYAMGMGIKSISCAFHLSRNTVRKYVRRFQESDLTLDQVLSMSEEKLQDLFFDSRSRRRKPTRRMEELEALVPDYVKRLSQKGVTVNSLHEEYLREHPGATCIPSSNAWYAATGTSPGPQVISSTWLVSRCT